MVGCTNCGFTHLQRFGSFRVCFGYLGWHLGRLEPKKLGAKKSLVSGNLRNNFSTHTAAGAARDLGVAVLREQLPGQERIPLALDAPAPPHIYQLQRMPNALDYVHYID